LGNVATAKVDLNFVIAGLAKDDSYSYSASPLSITAALGLLTNDVNAPSCASKGVALTASRLTATTAGLVTVNAAGDFVYTADPALATPKDDSFTYQVRLAANRLQECISLLQVLWQHLCRSESCDAVALTNLVLQDSLAYRIPCEALLTQAMCST
jgi:hypothetical protein